ncbi:acyl-CoA thioesterase [Miltoncostaea marina]|uniref:acyl-CoA thioesterase n=1 Tax=Miltoncostaea marina TaxID=2843215 RepID=UPI001C3CDBE9|nr:thioesterase family protein [Miltoncostaea marina]
MSAPHAGAGPTDRLPPFRFSARSRVDIADTDLGAVVYYGRYPLHIDRGVIAYRRHLGIPPLGPEGHLFVVRSLRVDYASPARFDEELEVFARVGELGRSSHTMAVRIERLGGEGPARVADAQLVVVGVAAYGARPSRMPASMRGAIAAFEGLEPG